MNPPHLPHFRSRSVILHFPQESSTFDHCIAIAVNEVIKIINPNRMFFFMIIIMLVKDYDANLFQHVENNNKMERIDPTP